MKTAEIKNYLTKLSQGELLDELETQLLFDSFFAENSEATHSQIGAYLFSSSTRPITSAELTGAARSLRNHMLKVDALANCDIIDTCGTGGSGLDAFNTSTVSAFIIAAAGQPVAKHGNRAATSRCGSADLLKELGISLELSPKDLAVLLKETNFCFMFAPLHHPATKKVQMIRKELGVRTIFNFLGPLANPAEANLQLLGISSKEMLKPIAQALLNLGTKRALIVCGDDGLDEITLTGSTSVLEIFNGTIKSYSVSPADFALPIRDASEIRGFEPAISATKAREILSGESGALRDLVILNSAASLYVAGRSSSIKDGIKQAEDIVDSGKAAAALQKVIDVSKKLAAS